MTEQEANLICDKIRQVAYDLHVYSANSYRAAFELLKGDEIRTRFVDKFWF